MSDTHNTPVGTPVVLAPGKIFLVGEYAALDDGCAVVAAITRYAKAQFIPRMDTMPPMVLEIVNRTKAELGEIAAALPPGAVSVDANDFQLGCAAGGLGSSAAIAVASVGAVYEALGLTIEEREPEIFALADAGRRAAQGDVGSGADTAAATYGGLIEITRHKDTLPHIERLSPPAGLHLVPFSAGRSLSTRQMLAGLQVYAQREPGAFGHAMVTLREIAYRFVAELTAGHATGAVAAAGKYGDELAKLAASASVPILTDAYVQASNLAREFGGIAKPTGAGGGEIGVGLFATPEAARWFRKACTNPLTSLDGDLERFGVRCRSPDETDHEATNQDMPKVTPSPEPDDVAFPSQLEVAHIVRPVEEVDMAPQRSAQDFTTVRLDRARRHSLRWRIVPVAAILLAALAAAWFTFPRQIRAWVRGEASHPRPHAGASSPVAPPGKAAPSGASVALPKATAEPVDPVARRESQEEPSRSSPAHAVVHWRGSEPHQHARGDVPRGFAPAPASEGAARAAKLPAPRDGHARSAKRPAPRAGRLSPDDF